jgi:hypothetical protein
VFVRFNTDQKRVESEWEEWVMAFLRESMQWYASRGLEEKYEKP